MEMASTEPMTTTNRMAVSESPNHRMASGSQQIEGSACSPSTSGLSAPRTSSLRASSTPSGTPTRADSVYPCASRASERAAAAPSRPSPSMRAMLPATAIGPGKSQCGQGPNLERSSQATSGISRQPRPQQR